MPYRLFALVCFAGLFTGSGGAPRQVDVCRLFGAVYEEKNPRFADYRVYIEESEAFSDLVVFRQDNRLFADRPGLWYFSPKRDFADFSVYFDSKRGTADFAIYYTETESFAGCRP